MKPLCNTRADFADLVVQMVLVSAVGRLHGGVGGL